MKSKLIGKKVFLKDNTHYAGHWGYITDFDGDNYTVTGGSIGDLQPIFSREDFIVPREKKEFRSVKKVFACEDEMFKKDCFVCVGKENCKDFKLIP